MEVLTVILAVCILLAVVWYFMFYKPEFTVLFTLTPGVVFTGSNTYTDTSMTTLSKAQSVCYRKNGVGLYMNQSNQYVCMLGLSSAGQLQGQIVSTATPPVDPAIYVNPLYKQ
jgi:hypothetical protein